MVPVGSFLCHTCSLHFYLINLSKLFVCLFVFQCVYPFGFKPLSNIIFPIDAKDYPDRDSCRRRKFIELRETSAIAPCLKLPRTDEQTVKPDLAPKCNGDNLFGTQSGQPGISPASQTNCNTASESLEQLMGLQMEAHGSSSEVFAAQTQFLTDSELHASASQLLHQGHASLPEPLWLQWRNMYSLCWLDCILSALVHLKTLQMIVTALLSENLPVIQRLLTKYNEATALVDACQRGKLNRSPFFFLPFFIKIMFARMQLQWDVNNSESLKCRLFHYYICNRLCKNGFRHCILSLSSIVVQNKNTFFTH